MYQPIGQGFYKKTFADPRPVPGLMPGSYLTFYGGTAQSKEPPENSISLEEEDAMFFGMAMNLSFPAWDQYECEQEVTIAQWQKVFADWETLATLYFSRLYDEFCETDYKRGRFKNPRVMRILCNAAKELIKISPGCINFIRHFGTGWKHSSPKATRPSPFTDFEPAF